MWLASDRPITANRIARSDVNLSARGQTHAWAPEEVSRAQVPAGVLEAGRAVGASQAGGRVVAALGDAHVVAAAGLSGWREQGVVAGGDVEQVGAVQVGVAQGGVRCLQRDRRLHPRRVSLSPGA